MARIPESVSAMVFQMRHKWLWTLGVWAVAVPIMAAMLSVSYHDWQQLLAFATGATGCFVGAMPLVKKEENGAHYVLAIACSVLSQAWCAGMCGVVVLLIWWIPCLLFVAIIKRYWCLLVELWCIMNVIRIVLQ